MIHLSSKLHHTRLSLSSCSEQKFVYKKTVSANLKCCIIAEGGGKPGNKAKVS